MKLGVRHVIGGLGVATVLALTAGLMGVGITNLDKPRQIQSLDEEVQSTIYPTIPRESRILPKTGPSFPSPGYEN